jgi:hypothetical protein
MALTPVGLAFPCEQFVFRAVPQLVLLDKVDPQNKRLVKVRNDVAFVFDKLFINFEVKFVVTSNWQWLAPC